MTRTRLYATAGSSFWLAALFALMVGVVSGAWAQTATRLLDDFQDDDLSNSLVGDIGDFAAWFSWGWNQYDPQPTTTHDVATDGADRSGKLTFSALASGGSVGMATSVKSYDSVSGTWAPAPFDAANFRAVKFRARANAPMNIRLRVKMEANEGEYGGDHGLPNWEIIVTGIGTSWGTHTAILENRTVPWGTPPDFDLSKLSSLDWTVYSDDNSGMTFGELWIDDITLQLDNSYTHCYWGPLGGCWPMENETNRDECGLYGIPISDCNQISISAVDPDPKYCDWRTEENPVGSCSWIREASYGDCPNSVISTCTPTVTYTASAGGTVSVDGGSAVTTYNESILLHTVINALAVPDSGFRFVKWSDDVTTASRRDSIVAPITFTATFEPDIEDGKVMLTYGVNDTTGGRLVIGGDTLTTYSVTLTEGDPGVTVGAIANVGWEFVNWSDDETDAVRTDPTTANVNVTAIFREIPFTFLLDDFETGDGESKIGYDWYLYVNAPADESMVSNAVVSELFDETYKKHNIYVVPVATPPGREGGKYSAALVYKDLPAHNDGLNIYPTIGFGSALTPGVNTGFGESFGNVRSISFWAKSTAGVPFRFSIQTIQNSPDYPDLGTNNNPYNQYHKWFIPDTDGWVQYTVDIYPVIPVAAEGAVPSSTNNGFAGDLTLATGWGRAFTFNPAEVVGINWELASNQMPGSAPYSGELYIDDIEIHSVREQPDFPAPAARHRNIYKAGDGGTLRVGGHYITNEYARKVTHGEQSIVKVEAVPNEQYAFERWSGPGSENIFSSVHNEVITSDLDVTAHFIDLMIDKDFWLSYEAGANGTLIVNSNANNKHGFALKDGETGPSVRAEPNTGYRFVQWSDGGTENPRTDIATADTTFTAEFELITYTLLVDDLDDGDGENMLGRDWFIYAYGGLAGSVENPEPHNGVITNATPGSLYGPMGFEPTTNAKFSGDYSAGIEYVGLTVQSIDGSSGIGMSTMLTKNNDTPFGDAFKSVKSISFNMKGTPGTRVRFKVETVKNSSNHEYADIGDVANAYYRYIDITSDDWQEHTISIDGVTPVAQEGVRITGTATGGAGDLRQDNGWGVAFTFRPEEVTKIVWELQAGAPNPTTGALYIDDVILNGVGDVPEIMFPRTIGYTAGVGGLLSVVGYGEDDNFGIRLDVGETAPQVTAVPNTGYEFIGWSDGKPDAAREDRYEDLSASGVTAVTALFAPMPQAVTFSIVPDGDDNDNGNLNAIVDGNAITSGDEVLAGKSVSFNAVPDAGYRVKGWTLGGVPVMVTGENDVEVAYTGLIYTLDNITAPIVVTVEFEPIPVAPTYAVTVTGGTLLGGGTEGEFEEGAAVTIIADVAPDGERFAGWTIDPSTASIVFINETSVNTPTAVFTMIDEAVTVAATYEPIPSGEFLVSVVGDANGIANASVSGTVVTSAAAGDIVTLTAVPNLCHKFDGWTVVDGTIADLSDAATTPATFTMPSEPVSITAAFVEDPDAHVWGDWVITKLPTFTETGLRTRTCSICGTVEEEPIPMLIYVAVTDIIGVPTTTIAGVSLQLTGIVEPSDANAKTITWSVSAADDGTTGATIAGGSWLNTTAPGTATVTATIVNGSDIGSDYTADFEIDVTAPVITISVHPAPATTVFAGSITAVLSVDASVTGSGNVSYQWYRAATADGTTGTIIDGATNKTFAVPTDLDTAQTYYYYCVVSSTNAVDKKSDVAAVTVNPVITITTNPAATTVVTEGDIPGSLTVAATVTTGAALSYQWYSNTFNGTVGGTLIPNATSAEFTIPTDLAVGTYYYYCIVSAANADAKVTSVAIVDVRILEAAITINTPPAPTTNVTVNSITGGLTVEASVVPAERELSYQWYSNSQNSTIGGLPITGANSATFTIPTNLAVGTYYYYCRVSATGAANVFTTVATVVVDKMPATAITWPTATAITYNPTATLSSSELTGGSTNGTFEWTDGTVIPTVANTGYEVTFTPSDVENYDWTTEDGWDAETQTVKKTITLTVNKATPTITAWPNAAEITYGAALSTSELSGGTGSVPGSFAWTVGTTIPTVTNTGYGVTFTPTDASNYNTVPDTVQITVNPKSIVDAVVVIGGTYTYNNTLHTPAKIDVSVTLEGFDAVTFTHEVTSGGTNAGEATVTVTGTDNFTGTATGTFTIAKANQVAPDAPTMANKTTTSITLTEIPGAEYSRDNGTTWQDATLFDGLTPNTEYTFVVRLKATDNLNASPASASAVITTDALPVYTVTWNADGGTPVPIQTSVDHGSSITAPVAMTKVGYTFGGWYSDAALTIAVTFPIADVTANTTLYAKWVINTYTVTWNADGGTPVPTQVSVNHGSSITAPVAMTKVGYTFGGWFDNAALTGTAVTFPIADVTANTTLYAKWTLNTFTVTLGGASNGAGAGSYEVGATVIVSSGSAPAGMRFVKWESSNTSVVFANAHAGKTSFTMPSGNVTITATWEENAAMLKAGPNTLSKSARETKIYYEGESFKSATLNVYDAMGNVVRKLTVTDRSRDPGVSRVVGAWDLKDAQGRKVGEGAYLIRGVITTADGNRVRVSEMVVVR